MKRNELSPQQLAQLYRQELTSAFPPEELKPDVYKRQRDAPVFQDPAQSELFQAVMALDAKYRLTIYLRCV